MVAVRPPYIVTSATQICCSSNFIQGFLDASQTAEVCLPNGPRLLLSTGGASIARSELARVRSSVFGIAKITDPPAGPQLYGAEEPVGISPGARIVKDGQVGHSPVVDVLPLQNAVSVLPCGVIGLIGH